MVIRLAGGQIGPEATVGLLEWQGTVKPDCAPPPHAAYPPSAGCFMRQLPNSATLPLASFSARLGLLLARLLGKGHSSTPEHLLFIDIEL